MFPEFQARQKRLVVQKASALLTDSGHVPCSCSNGDHCRIIIIIIRSLFFFLAKQVGSLVRPIRGRFSRLSAELGSFQMLTTSDVHIH